METLKLRLGLRTQVSEELQTVWDWRPVFVKPLNEGTPCEGEKFPRI